VKALYISLENVESIAPPCNFSSVEERPKRYSPFKEFSRRSFTQCGQLKKPSRKFVVARQLSGHPIAVSGWNPERTTSWHESDPGHKVPSAHSRPSTANPPSHPIASARRNALAFPLSFLSRLTGPYYLSLSISIPLLDNIYDGSECLLVDYAPLSRRWDGS